MKLSAFSLAACLLLPMGAAGHNVVANALDAGGDHHTRGRRVLKGKGKDDSTKESKSKTKSDKSSKSSKSKSPKSSKSSESSKSKKAGKKGGYFNRVASFPVCAQVGSSCESDDETASEIVTVTKDEKTIIYSNEPQGHIGFVDITDPSHPMGMGTVGINGDVTSVAVIGPYALAASSTGADFVNTAGELNVIDIETMTSVHILSLGGQPDAVAVSPDGRYAGIAIENERDEDFPTEGEGRIPQLPAGFFVIVDMENTDPTQWTMQSVALTGLTGVLEPSDPEPEFVSINSQNVAAITLQENNAIVLVDMETAQVISSFSAGKVDLTQIDTIEESDLGPGALIAPVSSLSQVPREPDGVIWISDDLFATADEGDMDGGSRGFTIFNKMGDIVYTSGNDLEHLVTSIGHYPDNRSENKGSEPESVYFGIYGKDHLLFVNVERSNVVVVYDVSDPTHPEFIQVLPAGVGPEGLVTLTKRNLAVVACEEDAREDKIRSVLTIYERGFKEPQYPTIASTFRSDKTPIPFGALSGLGPDPHDDCILYSIEDSFYQQSRIFQLDVCSYPAALEAELRIVDSNGVFAAVDTFGLINPDNTVNIDPEGIAAIYDDEGLHFFVASEGAGGNDPTRPVAKLNQIFKVDYTGVIEEVIGLPADVNAKQIRFGFEGLAYYKGRLYVAFQRAWFGEANPRIGIYDLESQTWEFVFYELDVPESPNGGWVGLSDITSLGDYRFLVLERDNQGGPDARIKKVYKIDLSGLSDGDLVPEKILYRDVIPDIEDLGAPIFEKLEGLACNDYGVWVVNDNDGVDDNSGDIQLLYYDH